MATLIDQYKNSVHFSSPGSWMSPSTCSEGIVIGSGGGGGGGGGGSGSLQGSGAGSGVSGTAGSAGGSSSFVGPDVDLNFPGGSGGSAGAAGAVAPAPSSQYNGGGGGGNGSSTGNITGQSFFSGALNISRGMGGSGSESYSTPAPGATRCAPGGGGGMGGLAVGTSKYVALIPDMIYSVMVGIGGNGGNGGGGSAPTYVLPVFGGIGQNSVRGNNGLIAATNQNGFKGGSGESKGGDGIPSNSIQGGGGGGGGAGAHGFVSVHFDD